MYVVYLEFDLYIWITSRYYLLYLLIYFCKLVILLLSFQFLFELYLTWQHWFSPSLTIFKLVRLIHNHLFSILLEKVTSEEVPLGTGWDPYLDLYHPYHLSGSQVILPWQHCVIMNRDWSICVSEQMSSCYRWVAAEHVLSLDVSGWLSGYFSLSSQLCIVCPRCGICSSLMRNSLFYECTIKEEPFSTFITSLACDVSNETYVINLFLFIMKIMI